MRVAENEQNMIGRVLKEKAIKTLFQPIVTIKSNKIMILEALSRGINIDGVSLISPKELFEEAEKNNSLVELDKICIESSLREFNTIKSAYEHLLLSININMQSILANPQSNWFYNMVKLAGVDPKRIIIEILEDVDIDIDLLVKFVEYNKHKGFLIAIDDIGSGYSGLMRMSILKPDIIKIDRSLIADINFKKSNQEIVRSLTELGHRLGILVTSEGIETIEESIKLMEIGVDLQQGFYYSKPNSCVSGIFERANKKINTASLSYKRYLKSLTQAIRKVKTQRTIKVESIGKQLEKVDLKNINSELPKVIQDDVQVELVYVLDNKGVMITNTISRTGKDIEYSHYIFKPANIGEDFSLKSYFIQLRSEEDSYISSPYISTATGVECVTVSKRFSTNDDVDCILCVDLMSSNEICNN